MDFPILYYILILQSFNELCSAENPTPLRFWRKKIRTSLRDDSILIPSNCSA